jgi:hypothetical protein
MTRKRNRGERNIHWIEKYCVVPSGPDRGQRVKLTDTQRDIVRKIYDDSDGVAVRGPLAAFLALLSICGPEAVRPWTTLGHFQVDIFTVWNATGPDLRAVLKRDGEIIVCPELGTRYPAAA